MGKHVLVVDDELSTLKLLRNALEGEGLEVATAQNGAECLLAVEQRPPDLVILDVMMPILDGFKTLRTLRGREETKHIPVVMLTARREDHDVLRGWVTGVDMYVTKPFQVADFMVAVRRILEATKGQPEPGRAEADAQQCDGRETQ